MKFLKVGVYHHDCWGSFSTKNFPTISMTEMGTVRIVEKNERGVLVDAIFRITAEKLEELDSYLSYIQTIPSIKKIKVFQQRDNYAIAYIQFLSKTSSYDSVLRTNSIPFGNIVQEKELEIHQVLTEDPKQTTNLLNELGSLGEVKVLRILDLNESGMEDNLTFHQRNAILAALNNEYYVWPRKISLDEIAKRLGIKRRTFQERLRKAESKIIPFAIERLIKSKGF